MARTIGALCTFIVCLQILIGVPLAVCVVCFCITNGPITVEVHAGHGHAPQFVVHGATIPPPGAHFAVAPPPNVIPTATPTSFDNPILQSRAEHGSPLTGTVLESTNPAEEQNTFVAALEKAAAENCCQPQQSNCTSGETCQVGAEAHHANARSEAAALIAQHLYVMADIDEHAGNYDRADQWRAHARQIRDERGEANATPASAASYLLPTSDTSAPTGN